MAPWKTYEKRIVHFHVSSRECNSPVSGYEWMVPNHTKPPGSPQWSELPKGSTVLSGRSDSTDHSKHMEVLYFANELFKSVFTV